MTSSYRRDHLLTVRNDELTALAETARDLIDVHASAFEAEAQTGFVTPEPGEGEKLALRRAMARFLIDSGIASARGWV